MDDDRSFSEDEWESIQNRFQSEGLEWESLKEDERLLHIFRWLVDAEANLKASRLISEKLQKQHTEEKQDLNDYAELLRQKCEKKVRDLEEETKLLRSELESLLAGTEAVTKAFLKENLHDIANGSIDEQIAYLLVERAQLLEELEAAQGTTSTDTEKRLRIQLTKTCTQLEVEKEKRSKLERQAKEIQETLSSLKKTNKLIEEENENLSYKLSQVCYEIDEKERKTRKGSGVDVGLLSVSSSCRRGSISEPASIILHRDNYCSGERKESTGCNNDNFRSNDNEALSLDSCIGESTNKLNSFLENQIMNSKSHLSQLHEAKKLQSEVIRLKSKSSLLADKYEELAKIHNSYKIESEHCLEKEKEKYEDQVEELRKEVERCRRDLTLKEEKISSLDELEREISEELSKLRDERLDEHIAGITKVNENEAMVKSNLERMKLLEEKIVLLEETNGNLTKKLEGSHVSKTSAG